MHPICKISRSRSRATIVVLTACVLALLSAANVFPQRRSLKLQNPTSGDPVPKILLLRILRAEDERRWDDDLRGLFSARNAAVRSRAALAAGRIGDEGAVGDLTTLLHRDDESYVRAMAAFALGEIEALSSQDALYVTLKQTKDPVVRARCVEALGKIAAALPKEQEARARELGTTILETLSAEGRSATPDRLTILLGLTAALRAKPLNAGPAVAEFLHNADPRIRADAANTLARLKLKDGNDQLRKLLTSDIDPIVRANAARVLGATEDQAAFEQLLELALKDGDSRVRVSAIRALASLKDSRAASQLVVRGEQLLVVVRQRQAVGPQMEFNEMLEIATSVGRLLPESKSDRNRTVRWLQQLRSTLELAPEVEVAFARVSPQLYQIAAGLSLRPHLMRDSKAESGDIPVYAGLKWIRWANVAQGLAELATLKSGNPVLDASIKEQAVNMLGSTLACPPRSPSERKFKPRAGDIITARCFPLPTKAFPDFLRAYAAFKPGDLAAVLRKHLNESDVIARGTTAELLGELPPDETNTSALVAALPMALRDKELNDAALAILDALAKQKNASANDAIKTALDSNDHLLRRKAVALLKANGAGDFSSRIGTVKTTNTNADYERAIARMGKQVTARVTTDKGSFTIDLLPDDATLNVDNFVRLAKRNYFNGITIHRVVPNFVIQDGDPRGDGNGGPGYQIRCEINEVPYERGAVGMALSGKDTGGSQWFVTHSPQPHLEGGYTVFGEVVAGMDTVDAIVRGDVVRSIVITESVRRNSTGRR